MEPKPIDWQVVIVGFWNRAILTPAGIAERLFELPKNSPVPIEVPIDGIAPYRVRDEQGNVVVSVDRERLNIVCQAYTEPCLQRAMQLGVMALHKLPETPVVAAGVNINYFISDPEPQFLRLLNSPIAGVLAEAGYEISERMLAHVSRRASGQLTVTLRGGDKGVRIACNIEKRSDKTNELAEWLKQPFSTINSDVNDVMTRILSPGNWRVV